MNKLISLINNLNLEDESSYEQLVHIFLDFFSENEKNRIYYDVPVKKGEYIYRSRNNDKKHLTDFSELSYPKNEYVKNFGRANMPFQSVFYGSDTWETTLIELMPTWKTKKAAEEIIITIGKWKVVKEFHVIIIPDFHNKRLVKFIEKLNSDDISDGQLFSFCYINGFFKESTYNNKHIYKITSAFCNVLRMHSKYMNEKNNGFLYTSVQDNEGWNLALENHIIDEGFIVLDSVFEQVIQKTDIMGYNNFLEPKVSKLDFENKKIIWED